jgi:hypothetical protein
MTISVELPPESRDDELLQQDAQLETWEDEGGAAGPAGWPLDGSA